MEIFGNAGAHTESSHILNAESENDIIRRMSCCKCLKDFFKKLDDFSNSWWGKRVRFAVFLILNLVSVASDWVLYYNVSAAEEGLVFGPPGKAATYAMLVFSILGSISVVPEGIFDWIEIIDKKEEKQEYDGYRSLIMLFTDIPLMAINLKIVACREQAISYYQIWKSWVIIFVTDIRIIIIYQKFRSRLRTENKPWGLLFKNCCVYLQLCFAIWLFVETQLDMNEDGTIETKVPHAILKGEYDDRRYFTNVSIYFSHPYLDYETNSSRDNINFIRLLSIYDLQNSVRDRTVNIKYDITHDQFLIQTDDQFEQCFTKMNGTVTKQEVCSDQLHSSAGQVAFTFHFVEQSPPKLIFGDITYNIRAGNNTNCEAPDFQVVDNMDAHIADPNSAMIRYYRNNPNITEEYHIIKMSDDTYQFYRESDLINIEKIWRRYWGQKASSARALGGWHPTWTKDWGSDVCNVSNCMHVVFHTVSFFCKNATIDLLLLYFLI